MKARMKTGDRTVLIISTIILALSLLIFYGWRDFIGEGTPVAQVMAGHQVIREIVLSPEDDYEIQVNNVTLHVYQGAICFSESSCSNQLCVRSGWLSQPGQWAACLPNQVMVVILGRGEVDSVT